MLYLYERFGARAIRAELADRGLSNMAVFDDVLRGLGSGRNAAGYRRERGEGLSHVLLLYRLESGGLFSG